ncbi:MAG: FHA domain-containing protein [Burkholderiaceae bacterium]|jgi:hypothetical protein|nr:FHA domain-containing protein [Burkholderiaceae bacterium]
MPKLIISVDGIFVKEFRLSKDRSTIGRRPNNDIVIDHLAISGKHAALQLADGQAVLEDLGSTNGTYVNGEAIRKQALAHGDVIMIGKYKIKYFGDQEDSSAPASLPANNLATIPAMLGGAAFTAQAPTPSTQGARLCVLSGTHTGHEMVLTKVVTTVGKPGLAVASIVRKPHGYEIAHLEGDPVVTVNGEPVSAPMPLKDRDQIELSGVRLEFFEH